MDLSKYKDDFVSEAKDQLNAINDGLLILEKDSSDRDNINRLFRAFHTLKGNAATMGYAKFSELSHCLEDFLSKVRDKNIDATKERIDIAFAGCDALEGGLIQIQKGTPENMDVDSIIESVKNTIGKEMLETAKAEPEGHITLTEIEKEKVRQLENSGLNVFKAVILFDKNNPLKSAKSLVALRNLGAKCEIIKTFPSLEDIKAGKIDEVIEAIIATTSAREELYQYLNCISGLRNAAIIGSDEVYERPKDLEHKEKELMKAAIADKHQKDVISQIQSVKVDMVKLDKLMNLVGELLISNIRLQNIKRSNDWSSLKAILAGIDRLILELQDEIVEVRMVPIGDIFSKFPRMVRDLANREGKKVSLVIEGAEIKFDRTVLDRIGDPIVHLLRNSVDHGIESVGERRNKGKPEEGLIKLIARREKNNAVIEVSDDGAGIDPDAVRESCIKKGIITLEEAQKLCAEDTKMLIFRPGASTNKVVTDVSGRGVGMDVVLNKTRELGGTVHLKSNKGEGTSVVLKLPLTVAIISALLVKAADETYAIPLNAIDRTIDVRKSDVKTIQKNEVFLLMGQEIPLFRLNELIGKPDGKKNDKHTVVVVNNGNNKIGLAVDSIINQQQILIKSLDEQIKSTRGLAGATILGDGSVAMIIDISTLLD